MRRSTVVQLCRDVQVLMMTTSVVGAGIAAWGLFRWDHLLTSWGGGILVVSLCVYGLATRIEEKNSVQ